MTFVNLLKRKTDRVGLEPVFDFQWHPLKNKTHIISDFIPTWDVQFGKIQKLTVEQKLEQTKKDFLVLDQSLLGFTSITRLLYCTLSDSGDH